MLFEIGKLLPRPGPLWGACPIRSAGDFAPPWRGMPAKNLLRSPLEQAQRIAESASKDADAWRELTADKRSFALSNLRRALRRHGLTPELTAQALGIVSRCATETLGMTPRHTQLLAAAVLLDLRLAEMATGEGKTLALALAAAVVGLAGVPVHLATANTYLAERDAASLAPLYAALGLTVIALPPSGDDVARRAAYQNDIVYSTAREFAFDFLRDSLTQRAQHLPDAAPGPSGQPMMRGLCMALIDEADSILLDEADIPLVLSRGVPQAARRAFLWQALAVARQLEPGRDFTIEIDRRNAPLTAKGEERIGQLAAALGGAWCRPRYRREAVSLALTGLHACHRDEHYLVRDGNIELLDEITGRIAHGRVWSRGLHTVVALKEGLQPPDDTDTVAQITFQRFFQRYWRVAGLSGTLIDARNELYDVFGVKVVRIPLHVASLCQTLRPRLFDGAEARWLAVCERVAELRALGRPVLIGTDSVADSLALSQHLLAAGIEHQVLNALNDAEEAAIVAQAGQSGRVTVATRMAGRGTDIELDTRARVAGGLHVLSCQNNPSVRLDRQLAGRAGRHGDPGSAEQWLLGSSYTSYKIMRRFSSWSGLLGIGWLARLVWLRSRWGQHREERRRAAMRAELLREGNYWERRLSFAGPSR